MNARPAFVAAALAVSLSSFSACAAGSWRVPATMGPESNLLCASDLGTTRFSTLHEAIRVLRPRFLRGRGQDPYPPVAYVDGSRAHDLEVLLGISPRAVAQVRFVSAADATTRFGTGHDGGALLVSTIQGLAPTCARTPQRR